MAIKIQTEKPVIPIEFGGLKFEFPVDDEAIKKFREQIPKLKEELEDLALDQNEENQELTKEALRKGYDVVLGEGSFDKVYQETPSIVYCMHYYSQLAEGLENELKERGFSDSAQEKAQKYLQQNKKQPAKKKK
ncbi:DUF6673 family protein [Oceanobacillus sp. CFH 90083]|uniref:DUF6673 family protein n=1 Tax=Oceanobacillus sp. CFH 90083 TaxID=2592336 RepID=UPI00128C40A3|nr:DUF6673 family protein [Oceanobacillus sp. CFH 90083]